MSTDTYAGTYAERVMLDDVERLIDATPQDLEVLFPVWKDATTQDLVYAIRFGSDPETTINELAYARDALDSLRRAREWEISDALENGSHWLGGRCEGCGTR